MKNVLKKSFLRKGSINCIHIVTHHLLKFCGINEKMITVLVRVLQAYHLHLWVLYQRAVPTYVCLSKYVKLQLVCKQLHCCKPSINIWSQLIRLKLKRKMVAITCCLICLEFWCGCLDTATAYVYYFSGSLCYCLPLLFWAPTHWRTSTCKHKTHRHEHAPTRSHPHDHPEQHYHNLGN